MRNRLMNPSRFLKIGFLIGLFLIIGIEATAQKKIKGDKEVISVSGDINQPFRSIVIGNDIKLTLQQAPNNSYVLTTDQNLVDQIDFNVTDEILTISTGIKITSNKKLEVFLKYIGLEGLTLNDKSEVISKERIVSEMFKINSNGDSKFNILADVGSLDLNMHKTSSGKIDLKSGHLYLKMKDRSDLKGDLNLTNLDLLLENSASLDAKGEIDKAILNLSGRSDLKAKKLKIRTANLNTSNTSDIHIFVSKAIEILAEGKSKIYLYGNPEISLKGLTDKSRIIKK
ncbi:GIN domain-containing protein [Christiangramia salexigens]|uniref:Putative auto-transporter adhesin head GIN domain-containing protein n=1 Tax=Christiangramia salexigens TaxID=1913577 RepID=A0A1L3J376_9FLAO|nr:DUF2807 domain-containing protein [Christiangramia salexigens]APG59560.1 hypothetical protein LPB144_03670 [Christiangramia salexigens]